ncbi:MAG: tetratricopeptide repeat protein [Thermoanaerobaculia bacterium]
MRHFDRLRPRIAVAVALCTVTASWLPELRAHPGDDAVFRGRERVTAIDLLIEFETTAGHELKSNRLLPKNLRPDELEVLYDGQPRTVIGIEEVEALDAAGGDWEMVVYFDAVLSTHRGLRWAATSLADRIERLTALGTVELVWADPFPKTLVEPTRDSAPLHLQLAEIAQFGNGRDELVTLRYQFLEELTAGADLEMAPRELTRRVAAEEVRLVRRQQDALLTWLTRGEPHHNPSAEPSARKLLVLVSNGYDLDPDAFYMDAVAAADGGEPADAPAESTSEGALTADTENFARTLAAYGWVAFNLTLPPPPPPPDGFRIGKWLLTGAKPRAMIPDPRFRPHSPADRHTERNDLDAIWIFLGGIGGKRQEHREPERAEAYLELGRAHADKGDLTAAEDAFRKAFYHFADDPKTATRQGEALIGLGLVLEQQGRQEARRVFELAHQRAPELFSEKLGASAALRDPAAAMELIARATAGWVVREVDKIEDALATLDLRVRITYQVSGPADGDLHPVAVRCNRKGYRWRVPGWARSATPKTVSAARARRLLANPGAVLAQDGILRLQADLRTLADPSGDVELDLDIVPLRLWPDDGADKLRISLGFGGRGLPAIHVEHHRAERRRSAGEPWKTTLRFPWPDGVDRDESEWLAVVVEDVDSGSWGAGLIDLYSAD